MLAQGSELAVCSTWAGKGERVSECRRRYEGRKRGVHSGSLGTVVKSLVWKGVPAASSSFRFCLSAFSSAVLCTETASKSPRGVGVGQPQFAPL